MPVLQAILQIQRPFPGQQIGTGLLAFLCYGSFPDPIYMTSCVCDCLNHAEWRVAVQAVQSKPDAEEVRATIAQLRLAVPMLRGTVAKQRAFAAKMRARTEEDAVRIMTAAAQLHENWAHNKGEIVVSWVAIYLAVAAAFKAGRLVRADAPVSAVYNRARMGREGGVADITVVSVVALALISAWRGR